MIGEDRYERLQELAQGFDETRRRIRALREARRGFPSQLLQRTDRFNARYPRSLERNVAATIDETKPSPKMTFEEWLKASAEAIEEHQRKHR